jgi:hypothetical protein
MKKLMIIFCVFILNSCDLGALWNNMVLEVIHNKTGQKFSLKKDGVFVFSLENNSKFEKIYTRRFREDTILSFETLTFEFEDGKVLEVEKKSSIYELISEKNIVRSDGGKGRQVGSTVDIYITEEVYEKAK